MLERKYKPVQMEQTEKLKKIPITRPSQNN